MGPTLRSTASSVHGMEGAMFEDLNPQVLASIDENADETVEIGRALQLVPELGYKEESSAAIVKEEAKA